MIESLKNNEVRNLLIMKDILPLELKLLIIDNQIDNNYIKILE